MKKQNQSISKIESMMQYRDHLEFMRYCEKIGKACTELVERKHVLIMATGEDLNVRCTK